MAPPCFLNDRSASLATIFALSLVPAALFVGGALDYSRGTMARAQMQDASDSAAISAVRMVQEGKSRSDSEEMARALIRNKLAKDNPSLRVDRVLLSWPETNTADVKVEGAYRNAFMRLAGKEETQVSTQSRATMGAGSGGEHSISFALDLTGSLADMGLDDDLRRAAADLAQTLIKNRPTLGNLSVSVVPFSGIVNIGRQHAGWLSGIYSPGAYSPDVWQGCVEARANPTNDLSDAPPGAERFDPWFWPSDYTEGNGPYNEWAGRPLGDFKTGTTVNSSSDLLGPNIGCPPPITPLSSSSAVLQRALTLDSNLYTGSGTNLLQALVWSWRTLSPRWAGLWLGQEVKAASPSAARTIVLMTDGENNWPTQDAVGVELSAYGKAEANKLGIPFDAADKGKKGPVTSFKNKANAEMDRRMITLCDAIKAEGIKIYTILFSTQPRSSRPLLRKCASSDAHFFEANDYKSLKGSFDIIATSVESKGALRLAR